MSHHTEIVLFGSLLKKMDKLNDGPVRFDLKEPTPLLDVLQRFNIPVDLVQLAMVNHRAVHKNSTIHPGDRLALFPKAYIVFADWHSFRF